MPVLVCHGVRFLSSLDEELFFTGLDRIGAVRSLGGKGLDLEVTVASRGSDRSLRELLSLFTRYHVDRRQLARFKTVRNRQWFCRREAYWFKAVFGRRTGRGS